MGTLLVNGLEAAGVLAGSYSSFWGAQSGKMALSSGTFLQRQVAWQRSLEAVFAGILSFTVFSAPCFCGIFAYGGLMTGTLISLFTAERGAGGLAVYLGTLFPQILFYIPVWLILAKIAGADGRRKWAPWLMAAGLFLLMGIWCESWLNPLLLQKILKNF
ncbi:MAG: hypothetical protein ACLTKI_03340 [Lachnospiraceae bacterium]